MKFLPLHSPIDSNPNPKKPDTQSCEVIALAILNIPSYEYYVDLSQSMQMIMMRIVAHGPRVFSFPQDRPVPPHLDNSQHSYHQRRILSQKSLLFSFVFEFKDVAVVGVLFRLLPLMKSSSYSIVESK
jgi:hypothetical protein